MKGIFDPFTAVIQILLSFLQELLQQQRPVSERGVARSCWMQWSVRAARRTCCSVPTLDWAHMTVPTKRMLESSANVSSTKLTI